MFGTIPFIVSIENEVEYFEIESKKGIFCDSRFVGAHTSGGRLVIFEGDLVFRDQDGQIQVLKKAQFYSGYFINGHLEGPLRKVKRGVKKGHFNLKIFVDFSEMEVCREGEIKLRKTWFTEHLLLRAKGCRDSVIEIDRNWEPKVIEVDCPGLRQ
jgi:hypothetical protein